MELIVYHQAHLFLGAKNFATWKANVEEYRGRPFRYIFSGHGALGGTELYDQMLEYLDITESAGRVADDSRIRQRVLERFPDQGACVVLDHSDAVSLQGKINPLVFTPQGRISLADAMVIF